MKFSVVGAAAAASVLAFASQADAAKYVVTYEGTMSSGYDWHNTLGYAPSGEWVDLAGLAVKLVIETDDATPGVTNDADASDNVTDLNGSSPNSPSKATLWLGDLAPYAFGASYGDVTQRHGGAEADMFGQFVGTWNTAQQIDVVTSIFGGSFLSSADWRSLSTAQANAAGARSFSLNLIEFNADQTDTPVYIYGTADNLTVTVSTSAAPEPAAWALMILGFGAAGGAIRARRRMAAA